PVRQLVRRETGWGERLVALDRADRLVFSDGGQNPAVALLVPRALRTAAPGTVVEICPAATMLAAALGARLKRVPGAALFIDYGYYPSRAGATLTAIRRHRHVSALDDPGNTDLSAHVDFAAFAAA